MCDITRQITESFNIQCTKCGGTDIEVMFNAGYIHDCGGSVGYLEIHCRDCGYYLDVDDEKDCI